MTFFCLIACRLQDCLFLSAFKIVLNFLDKFLLLSYKLNLKHKSTIILSKLNLIFRKKNKILFYLFALLIKQITNSIRFLFILSLSRLVKIYLNTILFTLIILICAIIRNFYIPFFSIGVFVLTGISLLFFMGDYFCEQLSSKIFY